MAREIRLGDIGDYANTQMEKLLRAAVLETDSLLKQASPVNTGRFRASWQVGENAAPGGIAPPGDYGTAPPLTRIGYGQEKAGNIYSVHNNLPYAEPLAGSSYPPSWGGQYRSKQASPGWVQGIAKDVQGRVIAAAARIGRES
tara:strand:+ start:397 stop:825 length:429 start_codon:yes stop_codon:yes gene_type:complete